KAAARLGRVVAGYAVTDDDRRERLLEVRPGLLTARGRSADDGRRQDRAEPSRRPPHDRLRERGRFAPLFHSRGGPGNGLPAGGRADLDSLAPAPGARGEKLTAAAPGSGSQGRAPSRSAPACPASAAAS